MYSHHHYTIKKSKANSCIRLVLYGENGVEPPVAHIVGPIIDFVRKIVGHNIELYTFDDIRSYPCIIVVYISI